MTSHSGVGILSKLILTSQRSGAQRSIYRHALLKIEHLIYFKGCSHSLSNQRPRLSPSISALTLLTTCFNSMLKSLTLFLSCCFLCPLFPPLLLSPPPSLPLFALPPSLPLLCASACKVGIGKIPKHLRNLVAFCLTVLVWKKKKKKKSIFCFALTVFRKTCSLELNLDLRYGAESFSPVLDTTSTTGS